VVLRFFVFAAALGIAPALAQQPAPPPFFTMPRGLTAGPPAAAPAAPGSPAATAPAVQQSGTPGATIPPNQFAAARDLVIASGMSRSFDAAVTELKTQLVATVTRTRPDLGNDLNAVMQQLAPEFGKQSDTMINNAARIYASAMTEQELKTATDFFNSAVGKRYVDFEPVILVNVEDALKQWTQGVSAGMMDRVHQEMKKRGHDF
jgi:hypothetical protein